jgi:hypothetical protein
VANRPPERKPPTKNGDRNKNRSRNRRDVNRFTQNEMRNHDREERQKHTTRTFEGFADFFPNNFNASAALLFDIFRKTSAFRGRKEASFYGSNLIPS